MEFLWQLLPFFICVNCATPLKFSSPFFSANPFHTLPLQFLCLFILLLLRSTNLTQIVIADLFFGKCLTLRVSCLPSHPGFCVGCIKAGVLAGGDWKGGTQMRLCIVVTVTQCWMLVSRCSPQTWQGEVWNLLPNWPSSQKYPPSSNLRLSSALVCPVMVSQACLPVESFWYFST